MTVILWLGLYPHHFGVGSERKNNKCIANKLHSVSVLLTTLKCYTLPLKPHCSQFSLSAVVL